MNKNGKRSILLSVALAAAFAAPGAWAQHAGVGVGLGGSAGGHGQAGLGGIGPVNAGANAAPQANLGASVDTGTGMMAGQSLDAAQHAAHRAEMKARAEEKKARAEANKAASAAGNASDQAAAAVEGNATADANAAVTSGADAQADNAADASIGAKADRRSGAASDGSKTDHRARKDAKNPKKQQSEPEETSGE